MEKIENDYKFTKLSDEGNMNAKNHQMLSYNMLFSINGNKVNEITLKDFKKQFIENEEAVKSAQLKAIAIKDAINLEMEKQGLINVIARKTLFKYNKFSITVCILAIMAFIIATLAWNVFYMVLSMFWILSSILFYTSTNYHEEKLTDYGIECREKAIGLKNYVEEYMISEDKPIYTLNIYDYYYIMAVAIGEAEVAEKEFIKKEYSIGVTKKNLRSGFKKMLQISGYIVIVIYYICMFIFS